MQELRKGMSVTPETPSKAEGNLPSNTSNMSHWWVQECWKVIDLCHISRKKKKKLKTKQNQQKSLFRLPAAQSGWGKATSSKDYRVQSHKPKEQIRTVMVRSQSWRGGRTVHKPDIPRRAICLHLSLRRTTEAHPLNTGRFKWSLMMLSATVLRPKVGSGYESQASQGLQPLQLHEKALAGTGASWGLAHDCAHGVTKALLVFCCGRRRLLQKMRYLWTKASREQDWDYQGLL